MSLTSMIGRQNIFPSVSVSTLRMQIHADSALKPSRPKREICRPPIDQKTTSLQPMRRVTKQIDDFLTSSQKEAGTAIRRGASFLRG